MQRPSNAQDSSFHLTEKPRRRKCGISQKGAIKTEVFLEEGWRFSLFQYQKGAIKTKIERDLGHLRERDFNTKKVRLKRPTTSSSSSFTSAFQYQKGAIKTLEPAPPELVPEVDFNTKKVRLKRKDVVVAHR